VEKLQLLNSPEERQRRLHEIPDVHSDPNLDSLYESDEDAGESDDNKQGRIHLHHRLGFQVSISSCPGSAYLTVTMIMHMQMAICLFSPKFGMMS
jgi:hypothetical protein